MAVQFELSYHPASGQVSVLQDGRPAGKYSQFARCSGDFNQWYDKLPQYCRAEANGAYSVAFEGGPLTAEILKGSFRADPNCKVFSTRGELITGAHRVRWAQELAVASGTTLPLLRVPVDGALPPLVSDLHSTGDGWGFADLPGFPLRLVACNDSEQPAVVLVPDEKAFLAQARGKTTAFVILHEGRLAFLRAEGGCFLFSCGRGQLGEFLRFWIQDFILPDYLRRVDSLFVGVNTWKGMGNELAGEKRRLLLQNEPYLRLVLPPRIERKDTARFRLIKLPEDLPCEVRTDNPRILQLDRDCIVRPMGEGRGTLTAQVKGRPEFSVCQGTEVYRYYEVEQIHLTTIAEAMEGEQVWVQSSYAPAGAHNLGQAQWDVTPSGLQMTAPGVFLAQRAGTYRITHTVGAVSATVSVMVWARPRSIHFDTDSLSVKLGDDSRKLGTEVLPANSREYSVEYHISDVSILDFDVNTGAIHPEGEGVAEITARLLDQSGRLLDTAVSQVIVLPAQDIVTPDAALLLTVFSLLGALLVPWTALRIVFGLLTGAGAVWYTLRRRSLQALLVSAAAVLAVVLRFILGGGG